MSRWDTKTLKPVPQSTRYTAERKRIRHKWTRGEAAQACGVLRGVWYRVMDAERVTDRTRELFKAFIRTP